MTHIQPPRSPVLTPPALARLPWVVLDLEATCEYSTPEVPQDRDIMEIIEVGAVWVTPPTCQIEETFHAYVRPQLRPTLSAFCTQLTGITQDTVNASPLFNEVEQAFNAWINDRPFIWASWGGYDMYQWRRDSLRHGQGFFPPGIKGFLNLKNVYAKALKTKRKGLGRALVAAGFEFEGRPHSGIDDARNAARLAQKLWTVPGVDDLLSSFIMTSLPLKSDAPSP